MDKQGIWKYENIAKLIDPKFRLTLGEGSNPIEKYFIQKLGQDVFFMREDLNPNKSFKDRSLAFQLSYYFAQGRREFVISSTGNAASSAAAYSSLFDSKLHIFVSESIPKYKLENMEKKSINSQIHLSKRPKSDAFQFCRKIDAINLRGSKDNSAVVGFRTLGYETGNYADFDAIFICCSSGTSTVGLYEGLAEIGKKMPIFVVQSTKVNPIAKVFDDKFISTEKSLAQAISDNVSYRKLQVVEILKKVGGGGWVVSDDLILESKEMVENTGLSIEGFNAYVSFAGLLKSARSGIKFQKPLVILTGI